MQLSSCQIVNNIFLLRQKLGDKTTQLEASKTCVRRFDNKNNNKNQLTCEVKPSKYSGDLRGFNTTTLS